MIKVTPQLIERYHLGQCSIVERRAVERWLAGGEMEPFEVSAQLAQGEHEVTRLWSEMAGRLSDGDSQTAGVGEGTANRRFRPAVVFSGVAAIIVVMFLFLWPGVQGDAIQDTAVRSVLEVPKGRKAQLTLSDGTVVHLNGGSRLEYPKAFGRGNRQVKLMGEAFFTVARDTDRPFMVDAGKTTTEVLGTAFNLSAYPDEVHTLLVEEGMVRLGVKSTDEESVIGAGRGVRLTSAGTLTPIDRIPLDRLAWKADKLVFNGHSLTEIATRLDRWYDVSIAIQRPELATATFTGSFSKAPLKTVMDDLAFVMQFRYRITGKEVVIF